MAQIEIVDPTAPVARQFVHLHLHTTYSLLDGAQRIGQIGSKKEEGVLNKAKELGMTALAITDHGNMFGAVDFYKKARSGGIKPILGCEVYMAPGDRTDKEAVTRDGKRAFHFVLLAQNEKGYRNLCKLVTAGYFEGFYYHPRIDKTILRQYSEGLIGLSACLAGELDGHCLRERYDEARATAKEFQEILEGRYFIELQMNGIPDQLKINPMLAEIARDLGIGTVATNDVHYITRADAEAQDVLMAIQMRKTVDDPTRMKHEVSEFYLKSVDEMYQQFAEYPEACQNTVKIAEMCNVELPLGKHFFPVIEPPSKEMDNKQFLAQQAQEGLEKRLQIVFEENPQEKHATLRDEYQERLEYELKVIASMGFSDYFLIVADFINWAKDHGIPVGPGRGSAAGSLVAFSIRITDIDPIKHDLLFERFLNPERVSMPDIDVDFCEARREEVIEYVRKRYAVPGGPSVGQIITFGKLKAKAVIRDVCRAYGMSFAEADKIAKLIPSVLEITLNDAIQQEPRLREMIDNDPKVAKIIDIAKRLEGLNRHASIHAAGVVISDGRPLDNHVPLYKGANDEVVTQFDMSSVEAIGLIKFDFLGLKNLTLIDNCLRIIEKTRGDKIKMDRIPFDAPKVFELLCAGDTSGVFQLESSGMREVMKKLKPSVFEDVVALVALYRPGPLQGGVVDSFINRKHGREPIVYVFPQLEPILKNTYGVCIYQEQVMQIANVISSYSLGEADMLRRAMGKKKPEEMEKQKQRFLDGAKKNHFDATKAEELFDILAKFAEYGFNKSHSAAYGLVAYQTAWLKAYYRCEYMAALFTADSGNSDKMLIYLNDCAKAKIRVMPPDINQSFNSFTVVKEQIRFGLSGVKNVGEGAIEAILQEREQSGPFQSFVDFCERIDFKRVNRRVVESLIKCGAFDSLGEVRAAMFEAIDEVMTHAQSVQKEKASAQISLFGGSDVSAQQSYKILARPEWNEKTRLSYEKEILGFYISGHPLNRYRNDLDVFITGHVADLHERKHGGTVHVAGIVTSRKDMTTKRGDRMAFVVVEDLTGTIEVSLFPDVFREAAPLLDAEEPLLIRGELECGEQSAKLIAKEVASLSKMRAEKAKEVRLKLPVTALEHGHFEQLKAILEKHKGHCATYLELTIPGRSETLLRLPDAWKIFPSEDMIESLERLFGENPTYLR